MRTLPVVALMIFVSSAAIAQTASPAATSPTPPPPVAAPPAASPAPAAAGGITRDDYIQKAQDRAAKAAAKRFDAMDADHDGVLTPDEIAAYRAAHSRKKASPPEQK
jgi:hypothetical protein